MSPLRPGFCPSASLPALRTHLNHSSFTSPLPPAVPAGAFAPPSRRPLPRPLTAPQQRRLAPAPVCQLGNVEDIPAERIPPDAAQIPAHWYRPGVYGVYAADKELQYVAAVRDVGDAIATHIAVVKDPTLLFAVRMLTVDTVDQAPLGDIAENWVMAHYRHGPGIPPGNSDEAPLWRVEDPWQPNVYLPPSTEPEMVPAAIKKVLRDNKVVLFMKGTREDPKCGFSKRTVEILDVLLGKRFVCVDVLDEIRNTRLREEIKKFSEWPTIPQLYVEGDFVGGSDIVLSMKESGELEKLLQPLLAAN